MTDVCIPRAGVLTMQAWSKVLSDSQSSRGPLMSLSIANLSPVVALIAGILILIMPRFLNFIVAIYLIIVGLLGLGIIK
jgi:hypothetical protein